MSERVSLVRCTTEANEEEIIRQTRFAIEQLGDYGKGLRNARKIAIKINAGVRRVILTDGKQTELTEPAVVEGVLQAIRAVSDAEIVIGDGPTDSTTEHLYPELGYPERLAKYPNVRLLDFNATELTTVPMAHSHAMFREYQLSRELADADAFVSIAKMKAHTGMGCTLCIKNLFGWTPIQVYGAPRLYLHDRLIRLPRVLVDMATWMRPCLNVVDGIVAANKSEWSGTPMKPGVILAGTNIVATDSVGARVMGFDPCGDYPDHPFFYRRNAIALAAEFGVGPNRAEEIEVVGLSPEEVAVPFRVEKYDGDTDRHRQILQGVACVQRYREQQDRLVEDYRDRYIALIDGGVLWDGPDVQTMMRLETESGRHWQNAPQFIVRCVPSDEEIEQMDWYQVEADRLTV